jgi:hypothetical protein
MKLLEWLFGKCNKSEDKEKREANDKILRQEERLRSLELEGELYRGSDAPERRHS